MKLLGKFSIKYNRYTNNIFTDSYIINQEVFTNKNGTELIRGVTSIKRIECMKDNQQQRYVDIKVNK